MHIGMNFQNQMKVVMTSMHLHFKVQYLIFNTLHMYNAEVVSNLFEVNWYNPYIINHTNSEIALLIICHTFINGHVYINVEMLNALKSFSCFLFKGQHFISSNPALVSNASHVENILCNNDTGGLKALQWKISHGTNSVSAGGHIEYWKPLYRCYICFKWKCVIIASLLHNHLT